MMSTIADYPEQQYVNVFFLLFKDAVSYLMGHKPAVPLLRLVFQSFFMYGYGRNRTRNTAVTNQVVKYVTSIFGRIPVYVVSDPILCRELLQKQSLTETIKFIGLDCEWVSENIKTPIALLQLATGNNCFLIRVEKMTKSKRHLPEALKTLLEDRRVLKFGVGIEQDGKKLRMLGINLRGFVDLRHIILRCERENHLPYPERIQGLSLNSLASSILGITMDKSYRIRCSDWEANDLSQRQICYAANDALVALEIFYALVLQCIVSKGRLKLKECFSVEKKFKSAVEFYESGIAHLFDQEAGHLLSFETQSFTDLTLKTHPDVVQHASSLCQGITDLAFKQKLRNIQNSSKNKSTARNKDRDVSLKAIPTRSHPLYENCYLMAPDGKLLCTCDRKKAEWYMSKGIGVLNKEEPFTVQLTFEPSGRPRGDMGDKDYYVQVKENRCVVCGHYDEYVRKMVIPHDYRKHLPAVLKDHLSHDVLLLCPPCHLASSQFDEQLKMELSEQYNAPSGSYKNIKYIEIPELRKVKSAARALLHSGSKMPLERKAELESILKSHANVDVLNQDLIQELADVSDKKLNENYSGPHGQKVIAKVTEEGKLKEFVKMWRQHFLDTMHPKYLPPLWSVDHNLHKLSDAEKSS